VVSDGWIQQIVSQFGVDCRNQLGGVGEREAAIRRPVEDLLRAVSRRLGQDLVLHPEVHRSDLGVRPDYATRFGRDRQLIFGYVELKSPDKDITPDALSGRDRRQWQAMLGLPNILYTNGRSWALYCAGRLQGQVVHLVGDLARAGAKLRAPEPDGEPLAALLRDFLIWTPEKIRTVGQLVGHVAPLCHLLKQEVLDQLDRESRQPLHSSGRGSGRRRQERPFTALSHDWEDVLFPRTDERDEREAFADRYAQTVTFALLLARVDGIELADRGLHEIGRDLGAEHTVMGRALQILTDHVGAQFADSLDMMVRVIGAVDWDAISRREPNAHVHLYERFLEEYDPDLRKASGTYYTPAPLADQMVRLTDDVLTRKLGCEGGFADPQVTIVDPAMGTGTFLTSVIDRVAEYRTADGNQGFRGEAVRELAQRLIGFEKQMAAYAVAQMRISQTLRAQNSGMRLGELQLHLIDTLADPWQPEGRPALGAAYEPLLEDSRAANEIKRAERVTAIIGNPPDRERAHGQGGWIEAGSPGRGAPLLDRFRLGGAHGKYENKLKNLYVYFWRWATYKVFEQHHPEHQQGAVCFISTAGFLRGEAFSRMREYLRSTCSEGWVIDLTPESVRPPIATRFFPGVQRELAIALFVRRRDEPSGVAAPVHYIALTGHRDEKLRRLTELDVDGPGWQLARTDPYAPFTPAATSTWDDFPALGDLMPWHSPGIKPNRTWVYSPDRRVLRTRWEQLITARNPADKRALMKETRDRKITSVVDPLPGQRASDRGLVAERGPCPEPVRVLLRSFDRQWMIPDSRLLDTARPPLWKAAGPDQVYISEQHSQPIDSGPGLIFSALIPDMHCFNGRGGRVLPIRHPNGSPNTAPGLLQHLANSYGLPSVTVEDLTAYIAGVTAHPAFTAAFAEELNSPGIRVPLTADRALWEQAVALGRRVVWASTFGERFVAPDEGRPGGAKEMWNAACPAVRYPQPVNPEEIPAAFSYDPETCTLRAGSGVFTGVSRRMREYDVGGMVVLDKWLSARSGRSRSGRGTALDKTASEGWQPDWSTELVQVLAALRHLTELEEPQAELLGKILDGPLIDVAELRRREVLAPPAHTQRPRKDPGDAEPLPGFEEFDGQETHRVQPLAPAREPEKPQPPAGREEPGERAAVTATDC